MRRIEADLSGAPVALLGLAPPVVFPVARRLIETHQLFSLDAIQLAVALADASAYADGGAVVLVTRNAPQQAAARAEGLRVWSP